MLDRRGSFCLLGMAALSGIAAIGCGGTGPASTEPSLQLTLAMYRPESMQLVEVTEGDPVDLDRPPQGGHVMFVGARVRGLSSLDVELRARLIDPDSGEVAGEMPRLARLLADPSDEGLSAPDLRSVASMSHVPVCPSASARPRHGLPYRLEVLVTELGSGRSGQVARTVIPSCRQADAALRTACECECDAGYVLGKCPAPAR